MPDQPNARFNEAFGFFASWRRFVKIEGVTDLSNKRTYYGIIATLGFLIGLNPFSIDMYLPGFSAIAASLRTDTATVGLSLASFFAGICLGQLAYGPIMDRYGRFRPLLIGLGIYFAASIGCAFAGSIDQLIVLRFVQALGGCAGMVASRAMVRDIFPVNENAKIFSMLMLVMGVAPIIAPSIGGLIVQNFDWHAIFIVLAAITMLVLLCVWKFLPESKEPDHSVSLNPVRVLGGYLSAAANLRFMLFTLAMAFATAGLFGYITSSPFLYMEMHGLTESQYGIAFSFCALCLITGSQINRLLLRRFSEEQIAIAAAIGLVIISAALLATMLAGVNLFAATLACIAPFMFLLGIINPNTSALALASVTKNIGMASALTGFIQMGLSALAAAAVSFFSNHSAVPMAVIIMACTATVLACVLAAYLRASHHSRAGRLIITEG